MKVLGGLLAAGSSKRFGGVKQLALLGKTTLIDKALSNYQIVFGDNVLVALGANFELLHSAIGDKVNTVYVDNWEKGIGHSISALIKSVESTDATHVYLGLADQVAIGPQEIKLLLDAANSDSENIICSYYNNIDGVPAVFPKKYFEELVRLERDVGAKSLFKRHADKVARVEMPNAAIDIDTQEALQSWVKHNV